MSELVLVKFVCSIDNDEMKKEIEEVIIKRLQDFPLNQDDITQDFHHILRIIEKEFTVIKPVKIMHYSKHVTILENFLDDMEVEEGYKAFKIQCVIRNQMKPVGSPRYLHIEIQFKYEKEKH
jgi:hypothetical protein